MISFLTLFLGLVAGSQTVEVSVAGPVTAVELRLDGLAVARLERPPWAATVDLGPDLVPHELVARALDESGGEVARARQWLNLPRPPAEIVVLLERNKSGQATGARVSSESLLGSVPRTLSATFDGVRLAAAPGRRIDIPAYDPDATHLLTVAAEFPNGVQARRDLVLGGGAESQAGAELTSVPVRISATPPTTERISDWFVEDRTPLSVVAVDHGAAQVLIVRDLSSAEALSRLGEGPSRAQTALGRAFVDRQPFKNEMRLEGDDQVRFLWPVVRVARGGHLRTELFESSHDFRARDGGLQWLLSHVDDPNPAQTPARYADAVAVAGLQAAATRGRRAVILVLGQRTEDASRISPAAARLYLEKLRVPLYVWSLAGTAGGSDPWGVSENVSNPLLLGVAFGRLKKELGAQWIVWLSGEHRPQDISLSARARGLELLR